MSKQCIQQGLVEGLPCQVASSQIQLLLIDWLKLCSHQTCASDIIRQFGGLLRQGKCCEQKDYQGLHGIGSALHSDAAVTPIERRAAPLPLSFGRLRGEEHSYRYREDDRTSLGAKRVIDHRMKPD